MKPLISVIIPIYNVEDFLQRCIDSVTNQTYQNLEIILIDDGSSDNSPHICDENAANDSRIVVIHRNNGGISSARNTGLDVARGEYLAFVDADDWVAPSYIESLYCCLQYYQSDIAVCEHYVVTDCSIKHIPIEHPTGLIKFGRILELVSKTDSYMSFIAAWNKLFKSDIWKELRFIDRKHAEDSFAMTEYIQIASSVSVINTPLYYYYQREGSAVHNFTVKNLDSVEARFERIALLKEYGYYDAIKDSLAGIAGFMNTAYKTLDLRDQTNRSRYVELRKQYKETYLAVYKKLEFSARGLKCVLYYLSDKLFACDKLYSFLSNSFHFFSRVMTIKDVSNK